MLIVYYMNNTNISGIHINYVHIFIFEGVLREKTPENRCSADA